MPFVQAKCPECGGMLAVDDSKKAANCQFCGEAFIVQEAVNNYNTYNTTNNTYNTDNRTTNNYSDGAVVNVYENTNSVSAITERAFMFLEEGRFDLANEYAERILDVEPKNAEAYLVKLMSHCSVRKKENLLGYHSPLDILPEYKRILEFGDDSLKKEVIDYNRKIQERQRKIQEKRKIEELEEAERVAKQAERLKAVETKRVARLIAAENVIKNKIKNSNSEIAEVERRIDKILLEFNSILGSYWDVTNPVYECERRLKVSQDDVIKCQMDLKRVGFFDLKRKRYRREKILEAERCVSLAEEKLRKAIELEKELKTLQSKLIELEKSNFEVLNVGNEEKISYDEAMKILRENRWSVLEMDFGRWKDSPIKWYVCSVQNSKMLLVSQKCLLHCRCYEYDYFSKAKTELLSYIDKIFNNSDKERLLPICKIEDKNRGLRKIETTELFLLSEEEFEKYSLKDYDFYDGYSLFDRTSDYGKGDGWLLRDTAMGISEEYEDCKKSYHLCVKRYGDENKISKIKDDNFAFIRAAVWVKI